MFITWRAEGYVFFFNSITITLYLPGFAWVALENI